MTDTASSQTHSSQSNHCPGSDLSPDISRRRVAGPVMFLTDALILEACVAAAMVIRDLFSPLLPITLDPATYNGIHLAVLAIPLGCALWGLYPGYGLSPVERLKRRTQVALIGFGLMSVFDYLAQNGQWSRGVLVISLFLALIALPLGQICGRRLLSALRRWGEPVALLGAAERRAQIRDQLAQQPDLGWIPAAEYDWPPISGLSPQPSTDLAILLPPDGETALAAITDTLPFRRYLLIPDLGGRSLGVSARETNLGLSLEIRNNLQYTANRILKRMLDLTVVLAALPLALPLIAVFALAVRILSPGPAFYAQWREGRNGRPFRLWKIRSMVPDAEARLAEIMALNSESREEWSRQMKLQKDPRIIPGIGTFIRRFSIDELPQLFNVLIGDMSMIGPRPLPAYHLAEVPPKLVQLRRQVRPGITGWAQISGRSIATVQQQIDSDTYYIRNWSLWTDFYILGRTVEVVVSARGAY